MRTSPGPVWVADRYEVVRTLGAGTQASVYLVFDHVRGESLALKTPASGDDELQAWDLLREAHFMGRLSHSCVIRLVDLLEVGGGPALLLDFAPGGSIREWMERYGRLSVGAALQATLDLAFALEHAHRHGVFHRDVKPGNLLIRADGSVALTDFGIATCALRPRRGAPGAAIGSPGFMAPEQRGARGPVDGRADVYGLGATLFRMCTDRRERRLYRCCEDDRSLLDGLPEPVAELVEGCCRFDPAERFQTMAEVRRRVALALEELPPPERRITGLCDPRGASRSTVPATHRTSVEELRIRLSPVRELQATAPLTVRRRPAGPLLPGPAARGTRGPAGRPGTAAR